MRTVVIVDDEPAARRLLYHALKADYRVLEAPDGGAALALLRTEKIDLLVLDLHLPPDRATANEGVRVHEAIHGTDADLPVVITTGDQDRSLALDMVRRGVADFLLKPIDPAVLKIVIARALERADLESELRSLRAQVRERHSFGALIGGGAAIRQVFDKLERLAATPTTVLLLGESGTGKSALARALHYESPRSSKPFVVIDGAAIPESLLESELFGHVRGAYTGADAPKAGRIQMAEGGSLFLDEIGNLSLAAQGKLLLFLDNHAYTPVGSNDEVRVNVRLIAATNQNLSAMVAAGRFRADLLYRLEVATVRVPALRERREDIGPLAEFLLASLARDMGRERSRLTAAAIDTLENYPWPGNVRQLRHVLESSLVLAGSDVLSENDLILPEERSEAARSPSPERDLAGTGEKPPLGPFKESVATHERELLRAALTRCKGNKAAAGRVLGLDDNQIHYLCRKHHIS